VAVSRRSTANDCQNIFVALYYWKDRQKLRSWVLSQCAVALLFAPWIPGFIAQVRIVTGSTWSPLLEFRQVLGFLSLFSGAYVGDVRSRVLSVKHFILARRRGFAAPASGARSSPGAPHLPSAQSRGDGSCGHTG